MNDSLESLTAESLIDRVISASSYQSSSKIEYLLLAADKTLLEFGHYNLDHYEKAEKPSDTGSVTITYHGYADKIPHVAVCLKPNRINWYTMEREQRDTLLKSIATIAAW